MPEPYYYVVEVKGPTNASRTQFRTDDPQEAATHFLQLIRDAATEGDITPFHADRLMNLALSEFLQGRAAASYIVGPDIIGITRTTN